MTALHTLGILSTSFTWNAFPTVLKEFLHMLGTCWLLVLHSAVQLIPNHLNWVEVGWLWRPGHLMSIARVSWPKQVSSYYWCPLVVVSWPWRPDSHSLLWTVDVEMCLLLELCEAFIWAAIWDAVNSNERILCSRGTSGFSFPVAVLMRASFIIPLDGFCDCTQRNFQSSWNFPDWLNFM